MILPLIHKLILERSLSVDIEAGITLKIKDDAFRPGTVRVHLPAPINASWLKEGQLLDSDPMFRMASVEDYPQRSVYFNERLTENTPFSVKYAFTSTHKYVKPDLALIDSTEQKGFSEEEIKRFSSSHHCGCESYTALPADAVSILDVIEDRGIKFEPEYKSFIEKISQSDLKQQKNGTMAYSIYRFITEQFNKLGRNDHNIAFVSMCRRCGIPARWQGGWATSGIVCPDSDTNIQYAATNHDWAMVHLLPYGWIYVDCKFGAESYDLKLTCPCSCTDTDLKSTISNQKSTTSEQITSSEGISLQEYFFGNIDPCMVPTASAPKADLYPAKDYERADKTFNVYGEVELVPDKLGSEGHFEGYGLKSDEFTSEVYIKNFIAS